MDGFSTTLSQFYRMPRSIIKMQKLKQLLGYILLAAKVIINNVNCIHAAIVLNLFEMIQDNFSGHTRCQKERLTDHSDFMKSLKGGTKLEMVTCRAAHPLCAFSPNL